MLKTKTKEKESDFSQFYDLREMIDARTWLLKSSSSEQCIELFKGMPLEIQRSMLKKFLIHPKAASLTDDILKMKHVPIVQKK